MNFTIGTLEYLVAILPKWLDTLWVLAETFASKKYFKLKSTGGANYSWFLNTSGAPAPCPATTTGGSSGGGFPSTCSILAPYAAMFCKINIWKQS